LNDEGNFRLFWFCFKGALSRGFLRIGVKNVLKFKLNTVSRTQNKYFYKIKKRKAVDFLKGRTNHSQLLAIFFHETKENLKTSA